MNNMNKKTWIWGLVVLSVIVAGFYFMNNSASGFQTVGAYEGDITVYKSQSCGCCGIYSQYFKSNGNSNTKVVNLEELNTLKKSLGVPSDLQSCHTTVLKSSSGREYFVEGHIPLEAVEKLLNEQPDIKGIAMPGMPEGSPGMPGNQRAPFVIYAVNNDGSSSEFMRI